ncbi:MAG: hypothetical protein Q7R70_06035, partial [Candidatus Diapherotrites archaeon]|nr:hypothetical protein [Candidatus Diapherotrites archaeon]
MWGIMGLKTSPTGQYLKFATGKSNILAGNGLDVSIRNISDDGAPKSITFKCISGSNCDNIASLICTPGTSTLSTPCNTASLKGTGITFTGVNFFGRADAGTPKITANFTDSGTYKFQATISTAVPKTETLTVIVSGPSVEITGINFFQNSKDVGTLVDKEKGDLTVKITVKNNGIDMGWTGFMLLTVKDSKGTDIAASMDNLTPFQQLSGTKIFSFKIPANCTAGEVCLRDFEEGRNYSAVAVLERRASPFIYLGTLEKSFIVKQKQANVPELPLPLVLLCFAVVVVLAGFKAKRAD